MNADTLFDRINKLSNRNACLVFSGVYGMVQDRLTARDIGRILSTLEYHEAKERKEAEKAVKT